MAGREPNFHKKYVVFWAKHLQIGPTKDIRGPQWAAIKFENVSPPLMLCYMGRIICHTGYVLCIEIYTCLCCATRQLYATQTLHCRCREAWLQETQQLSSATYLTSPPPTTDSQPPPNFHFPSLRWDRNILPQSHFHSMPTYFHLLRQDRYSETFTTLTFFLCSRRKTKLSNELIIQAQSFYRTQVSLGSDLWVLMSVQHLVET